PAGAAPEGVPPSALDGRPAGGATGAEEASTRVSEAMRSRSDRMVFRCTSAAPPSGTSSSLASCAGLDVLVAAPVVAGRAASAPPSALRDTVSPLLEPADASAANRGSVERGAAGVEASRLTASGPPEGEASADRCTDGAPPLAPADGAPAGLPAPAPEREAEADTPVRADGAPGDDVEVEAALPGAGGTAGDAGVALTDGVVAPDVEAAGAPLGRTGRPGVAPRDSITSGVPMDGEAAARRALSASTIEAMPCRTSLLAPSDGAPAGVDGRAPGGNTLRLTVASADVAEAAGVPGTGTPAEASTTRCGDDEAAALEGAAAAAALGEVGAEGAAFEAADGA
ncbi:MAG: hypothetical protein Q8M03_14485, partial [Legionella sp.]|nr:hypothetical protein [Legionella sp.]